MSNNYYTCEKCGGAVNSVEVHMGCSYCSNDEQGEEDE